MKLFSFVLTLIFSLATNAMETTKCGFCSESVPTELFTAHYYAHIPDRSSDVDDSDDESSMETQDESSEDIQPVKKKRRLNEAKSLEPADQRLILAALAGQYDGVTALLKDGADADAEDANGPILNQVINSLQNVVDPEAGLRTLVVLINNSADLNALVFYEQEQRILSQLEEYISWHEYFETGFAQRYQGILDLIISKLNVLKPDEFGITPLALMAQMEYLEGITVLLQKDAPMHAVDDAGNSVLWHAVNSSFNPEVPIFLIKQGALVTRNVIKKAQKRLKEFSGDERAAWQAMIDLMSSQITHFWLSQQVLRNELPTDAEVLILRLMSGL